MLKSDFKIQAMKKTLYTVLGVILMITSCTKDLTDLNVDPKNPSSAPSYALFTNAQRQLSNTLTSSNVNLNIFRLIVQHWQETQYPEESQYDIGTREINDNMWSALYRDVLRDLQESKARIPNDVKDAGVQKNQIAINEIMQVYTYYYLVTTFGNIPYSEALDINKPFPKYDDAATVYNDLLARLDTAIGNLDPAAAGFGTADIVYNGSVPEWIKFANSFKLKMGMTIADVDPAKAKTVVETAAAAGVFTSNTDNAVLAYQGAPPNANPIWVDLVQSGRDDFVIASTLVETMQALKDPRIDNYMTTDQTGTQYSGAPPGEPSAYAQFSHVNPAITEPTFPTLLLDYAEVELLLAEAAARGFNVGGTAASHYIAGVTASITYWGGSVAEATAYLAQPSVSNITSANFRERIGVQKWLALYNRGWDAWIEWRRLDYPQIEAPAEALSVTPLRFPYPVNEQNVNRLNYEEASAAIGTDDVGTKLWWDKF
jgi:hypothetical protein